jgi:anaerobic selenocysteine-containing dehydrogenase
MQMFRYAEEGTLRMLWVSATNPAVSLPELSRIRDILAQDRLFLVVQDMFRTETAELADVVLPAAGWGEKTGTFTNVDRTVHLSEKAVDPPGEARADLDIFLDYARRMDFRDKDGKPLPPWSNPEEAFEAWKQCSAGRPCDYTGMSYAKLRDSRGIQWPCDSEHPDGTERLYADGKFWAKPDYCESYGRDLITGAPLEPTEYRAMNPDGKAILKAAEYVRPHEVPSAEYPFVLITGRTLYQFHTRTKTGRAPQLRDAAPEPWVEMSANDAKRLEISEGDVVEVATPRRSVIVPCRISGIRDGVVFVPFHYGYWDVDDPGHHRAANEMTLTDWDPVSKQPIFKTAAARVQRIRSGAHPAPAPTTTGSAPADEHLPATAGGRTAEAVEMLSGLNGAE